MLGAETLPPPPLSTMYACLPVLSEMAGVEWVGLTIIGPALGFWYSLPCHFSRK